MSWRKGKWWRTWAGGWTIVQKLFLLEASQVGGLNQGERLMRLYLSVDFRGQARDEASQEEWRWQADNPVRQVLKLR